MTSMSGVLETRATSRQLIGREGHLERLEMILDSVMTTHQTATIFVEGEAGIGKTRTLQEFASRARTREADVLVGRCVPHGDQVMPFAPFVEVLADLVRRDGAARVLEMAGPSASALGRLVPSLSADGKVPGTLRGDSSNLFQALCTLFESLSRHHALVLVIEDLHWVDGSTREMLALLATQLRGNVMLVFTIRTDEAPQDAGIARFVAEAGRGSDHRLALDPLSREEQARQISDILGVPPVKDLLDSVFARAEGNPFFAEELLVLGSDSEMPSTVRDLLLARLAALAPATRQVLRTASVIGRRVPHHLLEEVADLSGQRLDAALRPAVEAHVLVADDVDGGTYQFRHALLQEAIAKSLLPGEAARMHARVAKALVDSGTPLSAGRLANHWYAAGETAKALVATVDAAREAEQALAFNEALNYYDRAMALMATVEGSAELLEDPPYRLLWRAAEMAHLAAHPARAAELIRAAIEVVDPAEVFHRGYLHERLGRYLWMSAEGEEALVAYEEAVALTPSQPITRWRAAVLSGYSQVLMLASRFAQSAALAREAIEITQRVPEGRATEGHARNNLGVSLAHLGHLDEGVVELRLARRIAEEEMEDVDDVARAIVNLHSIYFNAGRFKDAAGVALEGIEVVERLGLKRRKGVWCRCDAAEALVCLGEFALATTLLEEAAALSPSGIDRLRVDICLGQLFLRTGDLVGSREHLQRARIEGSRLLDGQLIGPLFATLVEVLVGLGQLDEAAAAAAEGCARLPEDEHAVFCVPLLASAAIVNRAEASSWLALAEDSLRDCVAEVPVARVQLAEAKCATGPVDASSWAAVATAWDELQDPYRSSHARLRAAEARLAGDRAAAAVDLNDAWEIADRIGAAGLASEIRSVARRARIRLAADPATSAERPFGMTPREKEILQLVVAGRTDKDIGAHLFISHRTVERHVSNLLAKVGAARRSELIALAHDNGLVDS